MTTLLFGAGLVAVLSLAMMKSLLEWTGTLRSLRQQQTATDTFLKVTHLMRETGICTANFRGRPTATGSLEDVGQLVVPGATTPLLLPPQVIDNEPLRLQGMRLRDFQRYMTAGPGASLGTMELVLDFTPIGTEGPVRSRSILLHVMLNSHPDIDPPSAGPPDSIYECFAVGTTQDPWQLSSAGDVYYNDGHVGMDNQNPQTPPPPIPNYKNLVVGDTPGSPTTSLEEMIADDYFHLSDARAKDHIALSPGLEAIEKLKGVRFDWKDNGHPSYGVIAQNVESIFPSAVDTSSETGLKTVDSDQLIAPLIESLKDLSARNKALKARLATLEEKIQARTIQRRK